MRAPLLAFMLWLPLAAFAQGEVEAAPPDAATPAAATPAPDAEETPPATGDVPSAAAVRAAVDAGNYFFLKYFTERDAAAIGELYTEDGRVIAPGAEPASGRAAITAFWARAMESTQSVALETLSVEVAGEFALEEGVVRLTANDGSQSSERYLVVWKRVGRRWQLHRDIWNSGPVPAPGVEEMQAAPSPAPSAEPAPSPEVGVDETTPEPGA